MGEGITKGELASYYEMSSTASRTSAPLRVSHTWWGRSWCSVIPRNLTQEFHKVDRGSRILVDTGRNGYSATYAAAYTVRAKPGAPVSARCTWEELDRVDVGPRTFTLRGMAQRVTEVGDLWADMLKKKRSLKRPIERLKKLTADYTDPS